MQKHTTAPRVSMRYFLYRRINLNWICKPYRFVPADNGGDRCRFKLGTIKNRPGSCTEPPLTAVTKMN